MAENWHRIAQERIMARHASPWYREERNEWCVTLNGRLCRLGVHPADASPPKKSKKTGQWNAPKSIRDAFHKLTQGAVPKQPDDAVVSVLDAFIVWCEENRAGRTASRYQEFIQDFVNEYGRIPVTKLTSKHVSEWLATHDAWGSTTKRNAITALQRGFNWAVKNNNLDRNPIKGMEKPKTKDTSEEVRKKILTPAEFELLLTHIPDERFRDLLIVSYDSGARPQEIKHLEKRHIQPDKRRAVIPAGEAKGKVTRTIYFPTDRSWDIIDRLTKERLEGKLFVNRIGNPWTAMAVKNRLEDFDHVFKRRITHYALRHSRITDWLTSGVDSHVVAKLRACLESLRRRVFVGP
jgi:site-specific recombinase XerD